MCPHNVAFVGRRHLKKYRLVLVALAIVVFVAMVMGLARKHGAKDVLDDLASSDPSHPEIRTMYWDPEELLKTWSALRGRKPTNFQPMVIRFVKLKPVPFPTLDETVRQDLAPGTVWTISPDVATVNGEVYAFKGPKPSGTVEPDAYLTVQQNYGGRVSVVSGTKTLNVQSMTAMEARKLEPWEIWWLKAKSLGRNPYTSEQKIMESIHR